MDAVDYWRLCDEISVFEAVMLLLECDPSGLSEYQLRDRLPENYGVIKKLLFDGIRIKKIQGNIDCYESGGVEQYWVDSSYVNVDSLKKFLGQKGMPSAVFGVDNLKAKYFDQHSTFFAPKLAAAIDAWEAVTNEPALLKNKTPKQAIEKWLMENAISYGLTNRDNSVNKTAIEEISKVANWKPEGGAAKIGSEGIVSSNPPTPKQGIVKLKKFDLDHNLSGWIDDKIPF